jgi:hypothetical protein
MLENLFVSTLCCMAFECSIICSSFILLLAVPGHFRSARTTTYVCPSARHYVRLPCKRITSIATAQFNTKCTLMHTDTTALYTQYIALIPKPLLRLSHGSTHTTMHCSGSNHTTSISTTRSSLCSIALHTTNVNRHRLGNLCTYSPTTPTSFTWIYALNHALHFTFRLLTGGPSTSATLDPITQPVSALNAFHSFRLHCTRRMSIDTAQFHMTCNPMQAATNALYSLYID